MKLSSRPARDRYACKLHGMTDFLLKQSMSAAKDISCIELTFIFVLHLTRHWLDEQGIGV
jgi:hypothetical protein